MEQDNISNEQKVLDYTLTAISKLNISYFLEQGWRVEHLVATQHGFSTRVIIVLERRKG